MGGQCRVLAVTAEGRYALPCRAEHELAEVILTDFLGDSRRAAVLAGVLEQRLGDLLSARCLIVRAAEVAGALQLN